jgi:acyl-CoA reductase-like NAD-dependent aldehyde dehydrogenase
MQMEKIQGYLDKGREEGATVYHGGEPASVIDLPAGHFMTPTIFTDAHNDMAIAREEIFGPVSVVMGWNDEAEVIRLANDSLYGLASGLWTRDLGRAHRMSRSIEAGAVWINRYFNFMGGVSGGAHKQSGFGREFGRDAALETYTHTKAVMINLDERPVGIFG